MLRVKSFETCLKQVVEGFKRSHVRLANRGSKETNPRFVKGTRRAYQNIIGLDEAILKNAKRAFFSETNIP